MFAAPILIDRSMTNYSAGVSENGNRIKSKMAAKYRDKRTSITTVWDQYPSYDIFPTHLIFHYQLPLKAKLKLSKGTTITSCRSLIIRSICTHGKLPWLTGPAGCCSDLAPYSKSIIIFKQILHMPFKPTSINDKTKSNVKNTSETFHDFQ